MNRNMIVTVTATALMATACTGAGQYFDTESKTVAPVGDIQLGNLPVALPPLVKTMVANSVEIYGILPSKRHGNKVVNLVEWGQGVRLGPGIVATAGHAVIGDNGKDISSLAQCGNLTARIPTNVPTSYSHSHGRFGASLNVEGYKAERGPAINALKTPDLALLRVRDDQQVFATQSVALASVKLTPGSDLYTVNYEPTATGQERSPAEALLSEEALAQGLNQPAIFGMIALSRQSNQLIAAVDTQRSYGSQQDKRVRPGASGGPVYNRSGQLVGLIVQEYEDLSAKQLTDHTGFRFHGDTAGTFNEVLIQPVTAPLLHEFTDGLPATNNC